MTRAATPLFVAVCAATTLGSCSATGDKGIDYSSTDKTLGKWPAMTHKGESAGSDARPSMTIIQPTESARHSSDQDSGVDDDAGEADGPAGVPAMGGASSGGTDKNPAQPRTNADKADAASGAASRLTFTMLTHVQHMRLSLSDKGFDDSARGPKNMGAVWIAKPDGTFVRSLEVWRLHKERARHLVAFNKACECPRPDVTATATLSMHREHTVHWDMTSHDGATVPEGKYTLHVEVADYDVDKPDKLDPTASNAELSVDFDTTAAPITLMPEVTPYYTNLKLTLLAP